MEYDMHINEMLYKFNQWRDARPAIVEQYTYEDKNFNVFVDALSALVQGLSENIERWEVEGGVLIKELLKNPHESTASLEATEKISDLIQHLESDAKKLIEEMLLFKKSLPRWLKTYKKAQLSRVAEFESYIKKLIQIGEKEIEILLDIADYQRINKNLLDSNRTTKTITNPLELRKYLSPESTE